MQNTIHQLLPGARSLRRRVMSLPIFLGSVLLVAAAPKMHASFHLMQIEQIIGGVEGDATAQAIQLRMRAHDQSYLHSDDGGPFGPAGLVVRDAAGANPVTIITFPHDVKKEDAGDTVLIVSPNFSKHVVSTLTPDFTMTAIIPESYLAAGRLDYIDGMGDVVWSVSYGGAKYTGPQAADNFNGSFGTAFTGSLPADGTNAVLFQGVATAPSTANTTDYQETKVPAVFTSNAGTHFQLLDSVPVSIATVQKDASASGGTNAVLEVNRLGGTTTDLTVHYKVGGSATGGQEYRHLKGKITIRAGSESAKIKVVALPEGTGEVTKSVKVTLVSGEGYTVEPGGEKAKVKILGSR